MRLSGDSEAFSSGFAGDVVTLSDREEAPMLDWIFISNLLCVIRLESSINVWRNRCEKLYLFVISDYTQTDCSPDTIMNEFYHQLNFLLMKVRSTDIVVLNGSLNDQVGRLGTEDSCLGGRWRLVDRRSDNGVRQLKLWADHNLLLASTNYRQSSLALNLCVSWDIFQLPKSK